MRRMRIVAVLMLVLALWGCISPKMPSLGPPVREFTARDALEVLWSTRNGNAGLLAAMSANVGGPGMGLVEDIAEALKRVRAGEAVSRGATAKGVTVFVIDDFSANKFQDGRYHGDYVAALIKFVAPDATILTCDAWKVGLDDCLFDAHDLAKQGKINVVNMSLGIVGTYCEFMGGNFSDSRKILTDFVQDHEIFEPHIFATPQQAEALEHWVLDLRQRGVTVISSAGNNGYRRGARAPGCWSSAAVGAVYDASFKEVKWSACSDQDIQPDDRVCWSNYGQIFAPGARIDDVFRDGISFNGTSASAPIASGVAALVVGTNKLKGDAVARRLRETAVVIRDRFNTGLKHVRIDAVAATVGGDPPPPLPPPLTLRGFLDKNKNCVLDDEEILVALLLWTSQAPWDGKRTISDAEMISLLGDWIKRSNIC